MPNGEGQDRRLIALNVATLVIGIGVIAGFVWFILGGWKEIYGDNFERGLIVFTLVIIIVAIVLISLLSRTLGRPRDVEKVDQGFLGFVMEWLRNYPPYLTVSTGIGFVTVGLIAWFIITGPDFFSAPEKARGLITFAVAIVTVAIALLLVLYVLFGPSGDGDPKAEDDLKNRFTFGKDILMIFVGILGTIMGFYYGTDKVSPSAVTQIQGSAADSAAAATRAVETRSFDILIKQNYDDAVKAFDLLVKATPPSPNIKNINEIQKFLAENQTKFNNADDGGKRAIWKQLYCKISDGHMADGMGKEMIDKFDSGCRQPAATPTNQAPAASPSPTAQAPAASPTQ